MNKRIFAIAAILFGFQAFAATETPVLKLKLELSARQLARGKETRFKPKKELVTLELPTCVDSECTIRSGRYYLYYGERFDDPRFAFTLYAVQTKAKDGKVSTHLELGLLPEIQPGQQTLYSLSSVDFDGTQLTGPYSVSFQQKVDGVMLIPTGTINPQ